MLSAYEISLDSCRLGTQTYPVGKKLGHCKELTSGKSFNFCSHASSTWWPVVLSDISKCGAGMRQQVCVVVGSALRSEWLLCARGRCRDRASVGGTSVWSSLEFLRTISAVRV
ncbi:hypothetical protein QQF64_007450 [Cirrhinus molitorella]|uniref:Uncharacterized protein n=1 Tax=Cirrhinus molitorella TaxID=172907 RepID=A0ABR3MBD3_9TELE